MSTRTRRTPISFERTAWVLLSLIAGSFIVPLTVLSASDETAAPRVVGADLIGPYEGYLTLEVHLASPLVRSEGVGLCARSGALVKRSALVAML
ncbi:MAG: hypothetical protein AAGI01_04355, partial [Myxococcota bacterium]